MCFNKVACNSRHEKWVGTLEYRIQKGEEVLENLNIEQLSYFRSSYEILRKELVNDREIRDTLRNGWVIDAQKSWILVLGYVKTGYRYVPVHVKLAKTEHSEGVAWYISQAYYPTVETWGENFDKKICFCVKTDERKVMVG